MAALLTIGLCVLAGGVLTLVYGIPIKDFSFGNTLIIAGTVAASAGLVLIALAVVVRQLRRIAQGIEALSALPARSEAIEPAISVAPQPLSPSRPSFPTPPAPSPEPRFEPRPEPAGLAADDATPRPVPPPSLVPEPVAPPPGSGRARRNLLFVSSRRERERAAERAASGDPAPPGAYSELAPPASAPPEPPASAKPSAEPAPTVVRSGSVDGMAYSLYSDGSIEADLAEGRMRFASIAELRAHLDAKS